MAKHAAVLRKTALLGLLCTSSRGAKTHTIKTMIVERHGLACSPLFVAMSKNKFLRVVFPISIKSSQHCMAFYIHLQIPNTAGPRIVSRLLLCSPKYFPPDSWMKIGSHVFTPSSDTVLVATHKKNNKAMMWLVLRNDGR